MSTDYAADIRKYAACVDDKAVASIVPFPLRPGGGIG
jgi:hypothetical protein